MVSLSVLACIVAVFLYAFVSRMFVKPPVDARLVEAEPDFGKDLYVQLRILNATSTSGLAKKATEYLRRRGFDVVSAENTQEHATHSEVIRLRSDTVAARKLAYALGIDGSHVRTEIDSSLQLDCTVILGDDFQHLRPFR